VIPSTSTSRRRATRACANSWARRQARNATAVTTATSQ
jgi:hypothetical protein